MGRAEQRTHEPAGQGSDGGREGRVRGDGAQRDLAAFAEHRELVFAVAYRLLGSVAEAEDVVQDTWLRWSAQDRDDVVSPRAFLATTTTRLALTRLSSARARRETYVGPWLPEPLVTTPDLAEDAALAESVSTAMLMILETLSPLERAVFVLHDVFDFPYDEIAETIGREEPAVRQLAHRARKHVQTRRPRFETDRTLHRQVTDRFLAAAQGGDVATLMELLAPDVTMWTDGGGKVAAARRPIRGVDKVARGSVAFIDRLGDGPISVRYLDLNGQPGIVVYDAAGALQAAGGFGVADGRIQEIWAVRNPEKLSGLRHLDG
jgi:RNA polymerase sigma-70 factor (TIGR02957 family)